MKKFLFVLMGFLLFGSVAQAQLNGTISGQVLDAQQQPIPGIAVFFLGSSSNWNGQLDFWQAYYHSYTDANGNYTIGYSGSSSQVDSALLGVYDCNGDLHIKASRAGGTISNQDIELTSCVPGGCDAVTFVLNDSLASDYWFSAVALRDSASVLIGSQATSVTHEWTITGVGTLNNSFYEGPNMDTVAYPRASLSADFEFCYKRTASCSAICDTVGTITPPPPPPPSLQCDANFFVDTVNSLNWQTDIVLWENSSTDSGQIISYLWEFGDGGVSTQQYPTHTYGDTGIYNICLSITAVHGNDTCVSTYCDSVGFDANGNLHKSTGFTISVIDPATVGQAEEDLQASFDLFPNPSNGDAVLKWNAAVDVKRVEIVSMSGAVVRSFEPVQAFVEIGSMQSGAYLVRVKSAERLTTMKMIVR